MVGWRARWTAVTLAAAAVIVAHARIHGDQRYDDPPFLILQGVGLPAADVGLMKDDTHGPGAAEALHRAAIRASLTNADLEVAGARFRSGRMIVRFRDDAPLEARLSALSDTTDGRVMDDRASYANFDMVQLAAGEDPVETSRRLTEDHG